MLSTTFLPLLAALLPLAKAAAIQPRGVNLGWPYGQEKIRGVNLGGVSSAMSTKTSADR